jgi:hypothetical protein
MVSIGAGQAEQGSEGREGYRHGNGGVAWKQRQIAFADHRVRQVGKKAER